MWKLFHRASKSDDFTDYLDTPPISRKEDLLRNCQKLDVSIYIDDASETSEGVYASMRGVASEAELERRLNAKKTVLQASSANRIAIFALIVAIAAFVRSFY